MQIFMDLDNTIDLDLLHKYRCLVGERTQFELNKTERFNQNVSISVLTEISKNDSVIENDSWLMNFWKKNKIYGIITTPLTRNILVHLNSSCRLMK